MPYVVHCTESSKQTRWSPILDQCLATSSLGSCAKFHRKTQSEADALSGQFTSTMHPTNDTWDIGKNLDTSDLMDLA
jgi:hypothetical protein